ncbi:MAG: signal peptidase I [Pseudomonadota bacterium]
MWTARIAIGLAAMVGALMLAALWSVGAGSRPFTIPSGSMTPTLLPGDYLWAGPLGPIDEVRRGDVVVLEHPARPGVLFVSRVVGLSGDRVAMVEGRPVVNGAPAERRALAPFEQPRSAIGPACARPDPDREVCAIPRFEEVSADGARYETLDALAGPLDTTAEARVPEGHAFLLGDHRDNALDSRVPQTAGGLGMVPLENLRHKNGRVLFSTAFDTDRFWIDIAPNSGP